MFKPEMILVKAVDPILPSVEVTYANVAEISTGYYTLV